jgi:hypothetical protein
LGNIKQKGLKLHKVYQCIERLKILRLVIFIALREAGERQPDNAGGSRKLSAVASVHSIALNIFGIISVQVLQA